ncbi:hypothetical protein ACFSTH_10680 [Paenibacillus yanchengensis]|uniref:Type II secretion system protein GspF domain-containing protein n=1 Tax=Paenibacillus yanchengensis TaxID=2035833 RepID=A0ABW4YIV4_9BACL
MINQMSKLIYYSSWLLQCVVIAITIYGVAWLITNSKRKRWPHLAKVKWKMTAAPPILMKFLYILQRSQPYLDREFFLKSSGFSVDSSWYFVAKRLLIGGCSVIAILAIVWEKLGWHWSLSVSSILVVSGLSAVIVMLMFDHIWLRSLGHMRSLKITTEIYIVSNHLYYLAESQLHIHTKLTRCLPFTQVIKQDLERLLADWYHHPGQALQQFKARLATDDAMNFVETIDALRMHESSHYYELLKQRINDYKDKIELAKESRKETTSYVLFVIAGIPILYTFQVFIYPWVQEGQKLFMNLQ